MIATVMVIGALLLSAAVSPAQVDGQEAAQWARIVALDSGKAIRATLTPPKYLLERGFLSPDGEARRPDDRRLDGRFIAADADTLVLRVVAGGEKGVWRIPRAAIARIDAVETTVDQTSDGYLKGLALGAGLGLTTYIGFSGSSDAFDIDELPYLMAFYGIPASLIGWLVDNTNRGESFAPVATPYGGPQRGGAASGLAEPTAPATRRLIAGAGVGLGLSGTGRNDLIGPALVLSSTRPIEPKLEFEVELLASLARGEAYDWSAGYYLEDDQATEVTGRRAHRGDDVSALLRMNYIVTGERIRPYVATGIGLGFSRLQD
ncbi:MAG: hypothetical protein PVJ51_11220, partial [Acidobacteriota bacterium]